MHKTLTILGSSILVVIAGRAVDVPLRAGTIEASVTASCSLGANTVNVSGLQSQVADPLCSLAQDGVTVDTESTSFVSGLDTSSIEIRVAAEGDLKYPLDIPYSRLSGSADATSRLELMLYVPGPVRTGLALGGGFADGGDAWGGPGSSSGYDASGDIPGVIGCAANLLCRSSGLVPFTLGVPFIAAAYARGGGSCDGGCTNWFGGAGVVDLKLSVYEADGMPAIIEAVPEPSEFGVVAFALGMGGFFRRKRCFA